MSWTFRKWEISKLLSFKKNDVMRVMKKKRNLRLFEPESEGDGSEDGVHCQLYRRIIM